MMDTDPGRLLARVQLLEQQLQFEKHRNEELESKLRAERSRNVSKHCESTDEEEYVVNKVMERLESLKNAKNIGQVPELESMVGTLRSRLNQIQNRKGALEIQHEPESQVAVGDLQAQLAYIQTEKANLAKEKAALENALEAEQEYMMHKLQRQLIQMQNDKKALLNDKSSLQKAIHELAGNVKKLSQDKVNLEQTMEMEEEAFVNKLMRQLLQVMKQYKRMEKALESHGIRMSISQEGSPIPRRSLPSSTRPNSGSLCSSPATTPFLNRPSFQHETSSSLGSLPGPLNPHDGLRRDTASREARMNASQHSTGQGSAYGSVRRQDSSSSLGSGVSAMSRDVSVTRDPPTRESATSSGAHNAAVALEHVALDGK